MRVLLRKIVRIDPTTFVITFGMWCMICGVSLILPGNLFEYSPAWASLQAIHADDTTWGWAMAIDGMLLVASARMNKVPQRAAISAFSAIMWFLLGVSMLVDAYKSGFISIVGAYAVWGAVCCIFAVERWVYDTVGSDTHGVR